VKTSRSYFGGRLKQKYDAADFIVPPQVGSKGSERIQCRIQEGHARALKIISNSGVFPHQTKEDVIRWCIKYGLNELAKLEPQLIMSVMSMANAADEIAKDHEFMQKFTSVFTSLHNSVSYYASQGMPEQALFMIAKVRKQFEKMPQDTQTDAMWRNRYLKNLSQYDYLENAVKTGAPLPVIPAAPTVRFDNDEWLHREEDEDDDSGFSEAA
jgi:hypothetical protein